MKKHLVAGLSATALSVLSAILSAQDADAILVSRLGGQALYDTDLNITWLTDANAGAGSVFDNGVSNSDGLMTWANAKSWAASVSVGGFNDWRLPATLLPDSSCTADFQGNTPSGNSAGFFCSGSEMGHMFYAELSGTAGSDIATSGDPDLAAITNLMSGIRQYWSSTDILPTVGIDTAWSFDFRAGRQDAAGEEVELFAWAVRPGDVNVVQSVPEPSTMALFGFTLAVLGAMHRTSRSRRLAGPAETPAK